MFDIYNFEADVTVACVRNRNAWAAQMETPVTPSTRTAGIAMHLPERISRDQLLGTGLISALATSVPRSKYPDLEDMANQHGAARPRLMLRTESEFIERLQRGRNAETGALDGSKLHVSRELRKVIRERLLERFDLSFSPIDQDGHVYKNLVFYAFRSVIQPELDGEAEIYRPNAISILARSKPRQSPLTPDLIAAESAR